MFSFEQLRAFIAVAETLHFGQAARDLRMTQPPLSRQIQKLELELGVQLFVRTNRRVELTVPGQLFLDRARQIIDFAEVSRATVQSAARGERGRLTVGFTSGSSLAVLGGLLPRWEQMLPDVDIDLRERVSRDQIADLTRYRMDIGLMRTLPESDEFEVAKFFTEDFVVALPLGHPLLNRPDALEVDDLVAYDMITYTRAESDYLLRKVETILGERRVRIRFAVSQILSMVALVAAGFGFALVPRSTSRIALDGVAFRDLALPDALAESGQVSLYAVWRRDSRNPALRRALPAIAESVQDPDVPESATA